MNVSRKLDFDEPAIEERRNANVKRKCPFVPGAIAFSHCEGEHPVFGQKQKNETVEEANARLISDGIKYRLDLYVLLSEARVKDERIVCLERTQRELYRQLLLLKTV